MVNSKKKINKSTVAIVVLALLLVLSLVLTATGAWFTDSKKSTATGTGNNVTFGKLGAVTLTLTNAEWLEWGASDTEVATQKVSGRTNYMPGDKVTSAGVKIEYANDGTESKVFYLLSAGGKYYTITSGALVEATTQSAGEINKGATLEATGKVSTITVAGKAYNLDGKKTDATNKNSSGDIPNGAQEKGLDTVVGISMNNVEYKLAIIQSTNLTAATAYTELVSVIGAMA